MVDKVTRPLGFFVLALLIIESLITTTLIFSDLSQEQKNMGLWVEVALFLIVITFVFVLVWCKPKNLIYGEHGHLEENRNYGAEGEEITRKELEESLKHQSRTEDGEL